jgi:hypothetical protein
MCRNQIYSWKKFGCAVEPSGSSSTSSRSRLVDPGLAKQEYNVLDLDVSNWDMFFFNKQDGQGAPTGGLIEQR